MAVVDVLAAAAVAQAAVAEASEAKTAGGEEGEAEDDEDEEGGTSAVRAAECADAAGTGGVGAAGAAGGAGAVGAGTGLARVGGARGARLLCKQLGLADVVILNKQASAPRPRADLARRSRPVPPDLVSADGSADLDRSPGAPRTSPSPSRRRPPPRSRGGSALPRAYCRARAGAPDEHLAPWWHLGPIRPHTTHCRASPPEALRLKPHRVLRRGAGAPTSPRSSACTLSPWAAQLVEEALPALLEGRAPSAFLVPPGARAASYWPQNTA